MKLTTQALGPLAHADQTKVRFRLLTVGHHKARTVIHHFDTTPGIWLNALGISAIIGIALYLSVREPGKPPPDRWTMMRLFLMPFCVSSFSQLIKGKGFVLVFPPDVHEIAVSFAACAVFVIAVLSIKRAARP